VPLGFINAIPSTPIGYLLAFLLWFLIWTPVIALLEYIAHRWIMHKANRLLDPQLTQLRAHGKHHQGSNDHDLVDVPVRNGLRLTAPFILCVLVWGYFVGPPASVIAPVLALLTWCLVYPYLWNRMHRAIHDMEENWFRRSGPVFRFFLNHHLQHHAQGGAKFNYGTVFPWTDYVFRTCAPKSDGPIRQANQSKANHAKVVPAKVRQTKLDQTEPDQTPADPAKAIDGGSSKNDSKDPGLLIRMAMRLCEISPFFKKALWRRWYQHIAGYQVKDWQFMNYGFSDQESEQAPLILQPADEENRFSIQLYHHVASAADLTGLDVLEVGCGRGGGASFLHRYHGLKSMTGLDFSQKAIRFCREHHPLEGLSFVPGDAESMPFEDESFDAVINVESSHCYRSMPDFLKQVNRVLRPGGYFLFADLRTASDSVRLHEDLSKCGLTILERENITPNVFEALNRDSQRKLAMIEGSISPRLLHTFREFAAIDGSEIYRSFRDGGTVYERYLLQKRPRS
jgi:ubiquinone/menaquinone biosynthesis C-methylase UbiE/sterol desaturase/sphingolipid hydroxylase (fatty acid hydroxylase superfamily)